MENFETWRKNMRIEQPTSYLDYVKTSPLGITQMRPEYRSNYEAELNILDALDFYYHFYRETQKHLDEVAMKKAQKKRYNDAYRSKHVL